MYYLPTLQDVLGSLPRDEALELLVLWNGATAAEPGADSHWTEAEDTAS